MSPKAAERDAILLTGFPSYLARRVGLEILIRRPEAKVFLLHAAGDAAAHAARVLAQLEPAQRKRVVPLQGDVAFMDLGLPSDQYRQIVEELTEILDRQVFELTDQLFSGHSLKHLLAALGCLSLLVMLRSRKLVGDEPAA